MTDPEEDDLHMRTIPLDDLRREAVARDLTEGQPLWDLPAEDATE